MGMRVFFYFKKMIKLHTNIFSAKRKLIKNKTPCARKGKKKIIKIASKRYEIEIVSKSEYLQF